MVISMLKIRRPLGRLIFNMGIAIPGKTVFLIETAPWLPIKMAPLILQGMICLRHQLLGIVEHSIRLYVRFRVHHPACGVQEKRFHDRLIFVTAILIHGNNIFILKQGRVAESQPSATNDHMISYLVLLIYDTYNESILGDLSQLVL